MEEKEVFTMYNASDVPDKILNEDRRFASPAKELSFVLNFVAKIYKELKTGVYHSKEDIARLHNLAVNSIKSLLSTAQQYNLLELKYGVGYKVTPLFEKIFLSADNIDKKNSISESLSNPEIYSNILKEYNGRVFPDKEELNSILIKKYNLKKTVSNRVIEILFQNLKDYGFINDNNVLMMYFDKRDTINRDKKIISVKPEEPVAALTANSLIEIKKENSDMIEILIPMRNKMKAIVKIPENYTNSDLDKILRIIQAYKDTAPE